MKLQSLSKVTCLLICVFASTQLMGCAPQTLHNPPASSSNRSAATASITSSTESTATAIFRQKEVHFSDFIDANSITPVFDFVEDEVWFLAVNDSERKSLRYSIDKEAIVSAVVIAPGTRASNDPRIGAETVINENGEVSFSGEKIQLPDYGNVTPAALSPFGNTIAYTNNEKNVFMIYNLNDKIMKHRGKIKLPSDESQFFYTQIAFLNEQTIFLSLLSDNHETAVAIVDANTGNAVFTISGSYSASPINDKTALIRPSLGDGASNDLYVLTLSEENITSRKIVEITDHTEKMTIKYSDNGKFAVTNKSEGTDIVFTIYETENFSTIDHIALDNAQGQYDSILNGDYQKISNDGKRILILDNQWHLVLLRCS